jgi:hypothetical protein
LGSAPQFSAAHRTTTETISPTIGRRIKARESDLVINRELRRRAPAEQSQGGGTGEQGGSV